MGELLDANPEIAEDIDAITEILKRLTDTLKQDEPDKDIVLSLYSQLDDNVGYLETDLTRAGYR